MIGPAPEFTHSKYFVSKPEWHMLPGASDKEKKELEEFMNGGDYPKLWKGRNPQMQNPYYTWSGEVVDKIH